MSAFHNIRFPLPLAFGASGGPQRQTEIVTIASGAEQRNTSHADSRRRYDAGVGVKSLSDVQTLIAFFEARYGQLYGFLFRDPIDHSSANHPDDISVTDQNIGTGDGTEMEWVLIKTYSDAHGSWQRRITKPVEATVRVALDGVETSAFSISDGVLVFDIPPTSGVAITAGFEFDVPVRFDTDHLNTSLESFGAGGAVHVPLIEVLPHA